MENEVTYELKKPFMYAHKGEKQEASFITMTAPSFKQMGSFTPIKQAFSAAITEISEKSVNSSDEEASKEEVTGSQVMQVLYRWSGDMKKVMLHAEQLFRSGVALIDGETAFTAPLLQEVDMNDFDGMLGEYIANFIVPSLMDGM